MKPLFFFQGLLPSRIGTGLSVMILLGLMMSFPVAEAGLIEKLKAKRKELIAKRLKKSKEKAGIKRRPVPRYRSWYRDEHKDAYINQELLAATKDQSDGAGKKIIIDLKKQRAYLIVRNMVAIDMAISSGSRGRETPQGSFQITEKIQTGKVSTLYHVYMPYWMRIGNTAMGMHIGDLPGYPASHGCVRLPQTVAPVLFKNIPRGIPVEILEAWNEEELKIPYNLPIEGDKLAYLSV